MAIHLFAFFQLMLNPERIKSKCIYHFVTPNSCILEYHEAYLFFYKNIFLYNLTLKYFYNFLL